MEFEKININDYGEVLYKLDVEAFNRDFDYPSPSVAMTLSYLQGCEVYLGRVNGEPAGVLAYERSSGRTEVKQIVVKPQYQNKGYGRQIVGKLLEETGGRHVWLVTHPKNIRAVILYLKSGFVITGYNKDYYGDGEPRLILQFGGKP